MDDIFVISDLHLGRGKNPATGRYYSLEAFFYDQDFAAFCSFLCGEAEQTGRPFKLIFNGDTFDFLRIERQDESARSSRERRFGVGLTPAVVAELVHEILCGHSIFVEGIATVLAAGHQVIILPGNHDLEVQWSTVHEQIRNALAEKLTTLGLDAPGRAAALARLEFGAWFYHEPGRVWIEHGCQYDPENAFRYPLRGELAIEPERAIAGEQDLPLGNFIQRYLYNEFGHITFIVPSTRANLRYVRWLLLNQPTLLLRVLMSHLPFAVQVARRMAKAIRLTARQTLRRCHRTELNQLKEGSGLGEKLVAIDRLKQTSADAVQATKALGWQTLKVVAAVFGISMLSGGLWFLGFQSINHITTGFGFRTLMFLALNLLALSTAIGVLLWVVVRTPATSSPSPLRKAAERIRDILDVKTVCFGHTHEEVIWPLGASQGGKPRGWYFNSGTWIAVFTHDVLLPRERVQYTFLRIRDDEAELLQWSPGRNEARPVILLEETRRKSTALVVKS